MSAIENRILTRANEQNGEFMDVLVCFDHGKQVIDGKELDVERRMGFTVKAKVRDEALVLLRSELLRCIDVINEHLQMVGK